MGALDSLLGGVGSAVGGLVSGVGNILAQRSANKTNERLTRETNALQEKMFNTQLSWQEDMWNKSNEYNLPANQVERLLQAGINPAFVLGNGSMSEASVMSSPAAPSLTPPSVQALNYGMIGSAVSNGINTYFDSQLKQSQSKALRSESQKTESETLQLDKSMPYYIEHLRNIAGGEGYKADLAKTELVYLQAVNGQRISQAFGDTRLQQRQIKQMDEQFLGYQLQNQLAKVQLAYMPKMNDAQLKQYYATVNQLKAEASLTMARRDLTVEEKLNRIEERVGIIADSNLKDFNYNLQKELKQTTIDTAKQSLYNLGETGYGLWENNEYAPGTSVTPWLRVQKGYKHNPNRKSSHSAAPF